ncbi:MAG: hypothetical protein WD119_00040 [Pirellulaceae bacterium]
MGQSHHRKQVLHWRGLSGLVGTVWGLATVSVCLVCLAIQRTDQLVLSLAIGTASLLIALVAIAPLARCAGDLRRPAMAGRFIYAALLSSALRLSMTVMLVVILDKTGTAPRQTTGLWAIFWYSLLMATELVPVADISTGGRLSFRRSPEEPGAR